MNIQLKKWITDNKKFIDKSSFKDIKKELKTCFPNETITTKELYDLLNPEKIHPCHKANFISPSVGYRSCKKGCPCYTERLSKKVAESKASYSPEDRERILEKRKETNRNLYGVENVFQLEEVKDKSKNTKKELYGNENYRNEDKIKETLLREYGVDNPMKSSAVREKYYTDFFNRDFDSITKKGKQTKLVKYGKETYNNRQQAIETNIAKYGVDNPSKNKEIVKKISIAAAHKACNDVGPNKYNVEPLFPIEEYEPGKKLEWICKTCGSTIVGNYWNGKFTRCLTCHPINTSLEEKELASFIEGVLPIDTEVIRNDRNTISPKELDIFIPSMKIAFEYCGLYWHSDRTKYPNYHIDKLINCSKKDVRLITIFSDDWNNKTELVKTRLLSLLGKNKNKIPARKCGVVSLNVKDTKLFLQNTHFQGWCTSAFNYGLQYNGEVVSVMTFSNSRFQKGYYELLRFASLPDINVVGGASKLLSAFLRDVSDNKPIISYSNNDWGITDFYEKLGFMREHMTPPGYFYVNFNLDQTRVSRIASQKHKIAKTKEEFDMTELEIMRSRGYERVYDCGNIKWVYFP